MKYYRKAVPQIPLQLSNGSSIRFENVDHEVGIFATDTQTLIDLIGECISGHRGGVDQITAEDYLALKSKKNLSFKPRWREEFVMGQRGRDHRISPQGAVEVVAVNQSPPTTPEVDLNFRPTASK